MVLHLALWSLIFSQSGVRLIPWCFSCLPRIRCFDWTSVFSSIAMFASAEINSTLYVYRISSNNSRGRLFLFSHKKGTTISNISHRRSYSIYLILLHQAIKEKVKYMNITIEKTVKKPLLL